MKIIEKFPQERNFMHGSLEESTVEFLN